MVHTKELTNVFIGAKARPSAQNVVGFFVGFFPLYSEQNYYFTSINYVFDLYGDVFMFVNKTAKISENP